MSLPYCSFAASWVCIITFPLDSCFSGDKTVFCGLAQPRGKSLQKQSPRSPSSSPWFSAWFSHRWGRRLSGCWCCEISSQSSSAARWVVCKTSAVEHWHINHTTLHPKHRCYSMGSDSSSIIKPKIFLWWSEKTSVWVTSVKSCKRVFKNTYVNGFFLWYFNQIHVPKSDEISTSLPQWGYCLADRLLRLQRCLSQPTRSAAEQGSG